MFLSYSFVFALGYIVATASEVEVFPKELYPCRTSQSCNRSIRCSASGTIKWLYPNSTVITSTHSTAKTIQVDNNILRLTLNDPMESDAGNYTCCLAGNSTKSASVMLRVIVDPYFIYGSSPLYENKTALRYHDRFLNCSVYPANINAVWEFGPNHIALDTSTGDKYATNSSGLTIYNVTNDDEGCYVCVVGNVNPLEAFISLTVTWSPQLLSQNNETVIANISDEVTLNCSASSSPDPMYSWSIPASCSSCPRPHNNSILTFTANVSNSGKYVCIAENEYGNVSKKFSVHVNSKPIMNAEHQLITMDKLGYHRGNIMLTCDIQYAYPTPNITWNITTPLSGPFVMQQNSNDNSNFKMHSNGSIKIYHRFLFEKNHIVVLCSATNKHGSGKTEFHLWEHTMFTREEEFTLYIKNITNCHQLPKDTRLFAELVNFLRQWFGSSCHCDGNNNLYNPRLTCLDDHTGSITSTVHYDGSSSAQELINLTRADIQMRDPPVVHLTHGWILYLSTHSPTASPSPTIVDKDDSDNTSLGLAMMITVGITSFCAILAFIVCITVGIFYIKHKRRAPKAYSDAADTVNDKGDDKTKQESPYSHIYDEIKQSSAKCSKATNEKSEKLQDEVVFDVTGTYLPPPAYRTSTMTNCDNSKFTCTRSNDYYIEDEEMSLSKEHTEEKCHKDSNLNSWQSNPVYSKLIHCDNQ